MPRLERLHIENFRGATTPLDVVFSKDKTKRLVVIFGENGTGKTTIVDALDAIGNCSGGSLTLKSSTSLRDHLVSAGKRAPDLRVELTAAGTTYSAVLKSGKVAVSPQPCPPIWVLRRPNLQRFIEAAPAKRYEELRHLIGVEGVERSEDALKRAIDDVAGRLASAVQARAAAEDSLANIWENEHRPGLDWRAWATAEASRDVDSLHAEAAIARQRHDVVSAALRARAADRDAADACARAQTERAAIEDEVARLPGLDASGAIRLVEILRSARDHLAAASANATCPVCERPVDAESLRGTVAARLAELHRFDTLAVRRRAAEQVLRTTVDTLARAEDTLLASARRLAATLAGCDEFAALRVPAGTIAALEDEAIEPEIVLPVAADLVDRCAALLPPLSVREQTATEAAGRLNAIRELSAAAESSRLATIELQTVLDSLTASLTVVRAARREFTQRILDAVADECNRLYALVHPDEDLAVSRIAMDERQRASLTQSATFMGHADVPPQAYFSEAHLDTLGFCFWLALALRESACHQMVLVLDDIFSSVDAPHLSRIRDLILSESTRFAQVIVTTHQRSWHDHFTNAYGPTKHVDVVKLQSWSLSTGIRHHDSPLAVDALAAEVDAYPFRRREVAGDAGVLLEAVLDRLAVLFRERMERKPENAYTLDELLSATEKRLKRMEVRKPPLDGHNLPEGTVRIEPLIARVRSGITIRNQVGAHYNATGMDVPDTEVRKFALTAIELARTLSCRRCGALPSRRFQVHYRCACASGPYTELHEC